MLKKAVNGQQKDEARWKIPLGHKFHSNNEMNLVIMMVVVVVAVVVVVVVVLVTELKI